MEETDVARSTSKGRRLNQLGDLARAGAAGSGVVGLANRVEEADVARSASKGRRLVGTSDLAFARPADLRVGQIKYGCLHNMDDVRHVVAR